jgi:MFS family permease
MPTLAPWRVAPLGLLAVLTLVPVTLPVTVLRALVHERFGVSETLTSLFMSVNMIGAALAAPLAGALADRLGRRRWIASAALLADAALLHALTLPLPFPAFLALRLLEGCAHISALSILLAVASHGRGEAKRGWVMGLVGGGITLGVAIGAPLGGRLGQVDPLLTLRAGSLVCAAAALLAALALADPGSREERASARGILAAVREHRLLLAPLAYSFADRFTVGFFTTTFSLFLSRIHALPPARIGLLMALFLVPFSLLSFPFGRLSEKTSRVWMLGGGSLAYGLGTASLGFWPPDALPALMLLLGVASAVMFVPSLLLTAEIAPAAIRTTAMGAFNAAGSLGFIAGPLVGGLVSEGVGLRLSWHAGYQAAFAVAGASMILCVLATLPALRELGRRGSPPSG